MNNYDRVIKVYLKVVDIHFIELFGIYIKIYLTNSSPLNR